jgi:hypothetical protein
MRCLVGAWPATLLEYAARAQCLRELKFEKVPLDQALALERRGFQAPPVAPLSEEERVPEVGATQIP